MAFTCGPRADTGRACRRCRRCEKVTYGNPGGSARARWAHFAYSPPGLCLGHRVVTVPRGSQPPATGHHSQPAARTLWIVLTPGPLGKAACWPARHPVGGRRPAGGCPRAAGGGRGRDTHPKRGQQVQHAQDFLHSASSRSDRRSWAPGAACSRTYYPQGIDRVPVSYAQISPTMRQAIVAIEDSRFYQHGAIDFRARSARSSTTWSTSRSRAGPRSTQQYVKNVLILTSPNPQMAESALERHDQPQDPRAAAGMDRSSTRCRKNQILASVPERRVLRQFGGNRRGASVRGRAVLQHQRAKLTLPQAALLAGMVENPSATTRSPTRQRRSSGATRCWPGWPSCGDITRAAADAAGRQPLGLHLTALQKGCTSTRLGDAAFFCDYVWP